jgi:[ribosomal protein S18]-alanine N-acetyltransferase
MPALRRATPEDAAALARVHRASFDDPWDEDWFRNALDRPGMLALLAGNAAATDLQSFILVQIAGGESEILTLATASAARRSGLARALIVEAAANAALQQANAMFLEVAEDNLAALALYRRFGFRIYGRRRDYYIRSGLPAVDALMLRTALPLNQQWE